jgi:hypothetical protein
MAIVKIHPLQPDAVRQPVPGNAGPSAAITIEPCVMKKKG